MQSWRRTQEQQQKKDVGKNGVMRASRLKPAPGNSAIPIALLSSPSRGIDADTDGSLKNEETQAQFRSHISKVLHEHVDRFGAIREHDSEELFRIPAPSDEMQLRVAGVDGKALDSLQQIMLLVRKLREGCVAAAREDHFAREVYTLSTLLSTLLGDNIQLGSSLPRLVDLMEATDAADPIAQECQDIATVLYGHQTRQIIKVDLDLARSLLLLWLCIYGGRSERLGGKQSQSQAGHSSLAYHTRRRTIGKSAGAQVRFADQCQKALATDDIIAFRRVLLKARTNDWHMALLRRCVAEKRVQSWNTIRKAYMHLAVDAAILDFAGEWPPSLEPSDWIERVLLIDVELMPPQRKRESHVASTSTSDTPDAWDDESVDALEEALKASSLQQHKDANADIRAARMADALSAYGLLECVAASHTDHPLDRWRGRIVMQAGLPVLKLR